MLRNQCGIEGASVMRMGELSPFARIHGFPHDLTLKHLKNLLPTPAVDLPSKPKPTFLRKDGKNRRLSGFGLMGISV